MNGDQNLMADARSRYFVESEQQLEVGSLNVFGIKLITATVIQKDDEEKAVIVKWR